VASFKKKKPQYLFLSGVFIVTAGYYYIIFLEASLFRYNQTEKSKPGIGK